jgi:UDP-N-acetylmuramyl tripeptide synthase
MDLRLITAIFIGKVINLLTNLKGGGGTAAPGLYALKVDPNLVRKLAGKIKSGSIIIAGTNGKTTTTRILSGILKSKYKIIHNRQGSNLLRGVASTFINNSTIFGKVESDLAIWETDEAALAEIIRQTNPKTIVLLNLFRDQLDRYGEVETIREKWAKAISTLPAGTKLILNADDPNVSFLAKSFKGKPIYFGVEEKKLELPIIENVADVRFCLNCGSPLKYDPIFSAHLGHWSCPKCHYNRPKTSISASSLEFRPDLSTKLRLSVNRQPSTVNYSLPGLYNVYNVLAASAAATETGVDNEQIVKSIENFEPAFGRFQKLEIKGKKAVIFLIKNPAGANEVIRTISSLPTTNYQLLTILNDNIADGRDVSWIWDTNWEVLKGKFKSINTSGTRAYDIALRLKYADMNNINVHEDINTSIKDSINNLDTKDTLLVLPTYTAMLELQKIIGGKWHKE